MRYQREILVPGAFTDTADLKRTVYNVSSKNENRKRSEAVRCFYETTYSIGCEAALNNDADFNMRSPASTDELAAAAAANDAADDDEFSCMSVLDVAHVM